jgi:hydroxymethylpyrimidine/phosphomethylpyrimidine kinase
VTSQSSSRIDEVLALPAQVVRSQLESVLADMTAASVKTGMLASRDIVSTVASLVRQLRLPNLVIDPVMAATASGTRTLLAPDAVSILKQELLPLAAVVTPNVAEAATLSGISVTSSTTAKEAAKRILELGPAAVVVKGGHLAGNAAIDVLYDGRTFTEFSSPRVDAMSIHGTGCTFASAIAAGLALGDSVQKAVDRAKRYINGAIEHAMPIGGGALVLDHFWERRK